MASVRAHPSRTRVIVPSVEAPAYWQAAKGPAIAVRMRFAAIAALLRRSCFIRQAPRQHFAVTPRVRDFTARGVGGHRRTVGIVWVALVVCNDGSFDGGD